MSRLPTATTVLNGTVANVYEDQLGAVLTATANIGDSTITVDDTAEFDGDQGGSVQVAGVVYDYTAVDDETGIVTLATTLTTGADEGDGVQLWDTATDVAAFELRALVNLPGTDANGEAIDAAIRHNLQPLLAEGIREPLKGESVEMNLIGDEWMVVDIYGKKAKLQPAFGGASNVITGTQVDPTATSITATLAGSGSSRADGVDAIAVGDAAWALADSATAVGNGASADGNSDSGVALGESATVQAWRGVAMGSGAWVHSGADGGVALGASCQALGVGATVVGWIANASDGAIAIGGSLDATHMTNGPSSSGTQSISIGSSNATGTETCYAQGDQSIAIGPNTYAGASKAVALGYGANAPNANDFALGASTHNVKVPGRLNVARRTPSSSADSQGAVGDITSDDSYVYVKTSTGWKRSALSTF